MTSVRDVFDLLREQRGRYVWGVRAGDESLLSWQVGDPRVHLAPGRTVEGLECRHVELRGRWQVAILDGEVRMKSPLGEMELSANLEPAPGQMELSADVEPALGQQGWAQLRYLEGQALVRADHDAGCVRLFFDLETELELSGPRALLSVARGDEARQWAPMSPDQLPGGLG